MAGTRTGRNGRVRRAAALGAVAGGHAARTISTRATNVVRGEDAAREAIGRRHLETAERIVTVLSTMKGAAMKLGQAFSVIDVGLVPEEHREAFQAKLAKLQTSAEPHPFKEIRKVVEQDLGERLRDAFADFSEEPIAAASIGQVHRATLHDGRDVAVKVQYPGVREAVAADLKNLGLALKLLARISPGLDTKEIAEEVRLRITDELDYEMEAANHRAIAREYRGHPFIVVPDVITDFTRERMIVTEFVDGRRFEEVRGLPDAERDRLGEILFRFYVNGPFRHGLLNGDPHPGNSLFLDDGRVAFVDFGFFKRLPVEEREVQRSLLRAVYARDAQQLWDISQQQGVVSSGGAEQVGHLFEMYESMCGWFLSDEPVRVTSEDATRAILEQGAMRRGGYGDVKLPAEHIVAARAYVLVLAITGQLEATNNWFRIGREVLFDERPQTELGRLEEGHLLTRV
jgi:predicted unusual protein kinase regulating ubiquinone biosynthesis (AarF/ABC1/UbiB family)